MTGRRRRAYHRGNVKDDLILAAERILAQQTFEDVTVRKLCANIGVTPANFYNHFANLDELFAHVAVRKYAVLREYIDSARARHRKPLLRLKAGARAFVHFALENPQIYRLIFGNLVPNLSSYAIYQEATDEGFSRTVLEIYGEDLYDRFDRAASQKRCAHAYAFFALLNGLARDVIDELVYLQGIDEIDRFIDTVIDSLLLGKAYADLQHHLVQ